VSKPGTNRRPFQRGTPPLARPRLLTDPAHPQEFSTIPFDRLVEHAPDAFFIYDLGGRILGVNRRACEMLGYTQEELLAKYLSLSISE
jgi:PAS domain-containing protein